MQDPQCATVGEAVTLPSILSKKPYFSKRINVDGMHIIFKPMESYSEYRIVKPLVDQLSRSPILHSPDYIESMLLLRTYYPFVAILEKDEKNPDLELENGKIIAFLEVYMLPHLGRTPDSRLERFIVTQEFRNRGLGQRMVECAVHFSKNILGCNRMDLTAESPIPIHIYKKYGFSKVTSTNLFRRYFT